MASQTQGIQQLLLAEKKAAEKVAEAKKSTYIQIIFYYWKLNTSFEIFVVFV